MPILLILFFLLGGFHENSQAIDLPDIGISANTVMSLAEEEQLGKAFIRQLRRRVEIVDDLEINNYINQLGQQLVSYSDSPAQPFHFFVIKEPSINAFAVPGGFIGVHSGLILATHSEGELASVLAHEIAHVTQRHIARIQETSQRFSFANIAALVAAVVAGAYNPEVGSAAVAAIMAGNVQMQINFTRSHEKEADRVGMQLLARAKFDPSDMPSFFQRLQAVNRFNENNLPAFLRTHPVTTDRIAEALDRAKAYPKPPLDDTPLYHLMRAKLLVLLVDNPHRLLTELQTMLQEGRYRDQRATRYALALTLLATRETVGLNSQINWLLKHDGDRVIYRLLQAQSAWLQNQTVEAMKIYEQALKVYPGDSLVALDYAEKLLHNDEAAKAKKILLAISPSAFNAYYYRLLAQSHQEIGAKGEAHFALAENFYLQGQTQLAVEQLKLARAFDSLDPYLASRIEARYQELQQELRESELKK